MSEGEEKSWRREEEMSEKRWDAKEERTNWKFWRRKKDVFESDVSDYVQAKIG